ncbi:hypothetical protein ACFVS2_20990 [Brevibacillus sp. NPDC058079]|uniref:hypothetical protein n=1 Tax=Brevibacillus sp. NPDC058079 TaxID=3346330 RepID=UPI0036E7CFE7
MNMKQFKVISKQGIRSIYWQVIRIGHPTKGNYLMMEIYDRGAVMVFTESLLKRGFIEIEEDEGRAREVVRDIVSGKLRHNEWKDEYFLSLEDGGNYSSDTNMLFEEIDYLLVDQGKERINTGDQITIIIERQTYLSGSDPANKFANIEKS